MVAIPGGTFLMGSPKTEEARDDTESPQHIVTVSPFYMGKYVVTQAQWKAVAALPQVKQPFEAEPSYFKGANANQPAYPVSWHDAVEFCAQLSKKTGRTYRLPSEAEWEYACRAGTTTPFYFGETITPDLVNYKKKFRSVFDPTNRDGTTEVGSFPPNDFGLYDMHGNVWEWCADTWHDNYRGAPSDGRVWNDNDNHYRVLRGGSWTNGSRFCRSASRYFPDPRFLFINPGDLGFRVVCGAPRTP